ncbi:MAG TPA: SRPBCC domain-containing protein [Microbacterium sp.]|nr:SRPBCC domain-containing protein [Microbacterium sp.]
MTSADTGSSRGSVGVAPDGSFQVRFARNLPAAPAGVWARLADPAALAAWLPGSRIDARVGGEVRFDFGDEGAAVGEVTRADPPADGSAALAHAWRWDDLPPSNVEWSLEATTDGTRLALVHRDLTEQPAREFALGWHMILDALRLAIDGQPTDAAWEVDDAVTAAYFGE